MKQSINGIPYYCLYINVQRTVTGDELLGEDQYTKILDFIKEFSVIQKDVTRETIYDDIMRKIVVNRNLMADILKYVKIR